MVAVAAQCAVAALAVGAVLARHRVGPQEKGSGPMPGVSGPAKAGPAGAAVPTAARLAAVTLLRVLTTSVTLTLFGAMAVAVYARQAGVLGPLMLPKADELDTALMTVIVLLTTPVVMSVAMLVADMASPSLQVRSRLAAMNLAGSAAAGAVGGAHVVDFGAARSSGDQPATRGRLSGLLLAAWRGLYLSAGLWRPRLLLQAVVAAGAGGGAATAAAHRAHVRVLRRLTAGSVLLLELPLAVISLVLLLFLRDASRGAAGDVAVSTAVTACALVLQLWHLYDSMMSLAVLKGGVDPSARLFGGGTAPEAADAGEDAASSSPDGGEHAGRAAPSWRANVVAAMARGGGRGQQQRAAPAPALTPHPPPPRRREEAQLVPPRRRADVPSEPTALAFDTDDADGAEGSAPAGGPGGRGTVVANPAFARSAAGGVPSPRAPAAGGGGRGFHGRLDAGPPVGSEGAHSAAVQRELDDLVSCAASSDALRLASHREFFQHNTHLLPEVREAMAQVPMPTIWMQLLATLDRHQRARAGGGAAEEDDDDDSQLWGSQGGTPQSFSDVDEVCASPPGSAPRSYS